jgi:hypothetical protein
MHWRCTSIPFSNWFYDIIERFKQNVIELFGRAQDSRWRTTEGSEEASSDFIQGRLMPAEDPDSGSLQGSQKAPREGRSDPGRGQGPEAAG